MSSPLILNLNLSLIEKTDDRSPGRQISQVNASIENECEALALSKTLRAVADMLSSRYATSDITWVHPIEAPEGGTVSEKG